MTIEEKIKEKFKKIANNTNLIGKTYKKYLDAEIEQYLN
jgi:hypothetical protein